MSQSACTLTEVIVRVVHEAGGGAPLAFTNFPDLDPGMAEFSPSAGPAAPST